jgi:hypothetical protein
LAHKGCEQLVPLQQRYLVSGEVRQRQCGLPLLSIAEI